MWLLRTSLLTVLVAIALLAQTPFSAISDPRARAVAVRDARKQLSGRTDAAAMAEWRSVLTEMHLSKDPELKGVVQTLRALDLYDNNLWIDLVNTGYAYIGDSDSARRFRAELARRLPDSSWAVQAAIQQWESTHRPRSTAQSGFIEWGIERVEFLKSLREEKPHSDAAAREYLEAALLYGSRLPADRALAAADLALQQRSVLPFDPRFQIVQIYLHHHARLDEVPGLLDEAVRSLQLSLRDRLDGKDAEHANQELVAAQFHAHRGLAEYWLQKGDIEQARIFARQAGVDLVRLTPEAGGQLNRPAISEIRWKLLSDLAQRVGIEVEPAVQASELDWSKVGRVPLHDFVATDLGGRRWSNQDWRGKVVLVNMWATWCAPCRAELPYLQKLHEAFRGRTDRLIISVNVDSDAELVRRLVREQRYTFPVLNSRQLADRIDFEKGVPQNRIVDTLGRLLVEPVEGTGDAWVVRVRNLMDQVK